MAQCAQNGRSMVSLVMASRDRGVIQSVCSLFACVASRRVVEVVGIVS